MVTLHYNLLIWGRLKKANFIKIRTIYKEGKKL